MNIAFFSFLLDCFFTIITSHLLFLCSSSPVLGLKKEGKSITSNLTTEVCVVLLGVVTLNYAMKVLNQFTVSDGIVLKTLIHIMDYKGLVSRSMILSRPFTKQLLSLTTGNIICA